MADPTKFKPRRWVNARPFLGWWRICANPSFRSYLLAQAKFNESSCFFFIITQSMMLASSL